MFYIEHASFRCYGCQSSSGTDATGDIDLTQVDPVTFEYPYAANLRNIPVGSPVTIFVYDQYVSPNSVADGIYVNGTKVSYDSFGARETGTFRVSSDGTVY